MTRQYLTPFGRPTTTADLVSLLGQYHDRAQCEAPDVCFHCLVLAALPTPKAPKPPAEKPAAPDLATMTDAQVFAHYKKTGYIEDVRFSMLNLPEPFDNRMAGLLTEAENGLPKAEVVRRRMAIRDAWRAATNDRAQFTPAQALVADESEAA